MRRLTRHEVNLLKGLVKALNGGLAALVQDLERQSAPTIHLEWLSTNAASQTGPLRTVEACSL